MIVDFAPNLHPNHFKELGDLNPHSLTPVMIDYLEIVSKNCVINILFESIGMRGSGNAFTFLHGLQTEGWLDTRNIQKYCEHDSEFKLFYQYKLSDLAFYSYFNDPYLLKKDKLDLLKTIRDDGYLAFPKNKAGKHWAFQQCLELEAGGWLIGDPINRSYHDAVIFTLSEDAVKGFNKSPQPDR